MFVARRSAGLPQHLEQILASSAILQLGHGSAAPSARRWHFPRPRDVGQCAGVAGGFFLAADAGMTRSAACHAPRAPKFSHPMRLGGHGVVWSMRFFCAAPRPLRGAPPPPSTTVAPRRFSRLVLGLEHSAMLLEGSRNFLHTWEKFRNFLVSLQLRRNKVPLGPATAPELFPLLSSTEHLMLQGFSQ